jgi:UDP-N-acetylmuramate dehydrogenase
MQKIQENVDSKMYSTFKIGGNFRYFVEIKEKEDILEAFAFAKEKSLPILIIGGGSNSIFSNEVLNVLAIRINILGFEIVSEDSQFMEVKAGAGETWDQMVEKTINMNLQGLETLSAIPGTVGATPVQNVGAYGAEVKDTIASVEVFDTSENKFTELSSEDCKFGYRDSIFKNEAKGRYIITSVTFKLKKVDDNKSLLEKREEITKTRWSKLPNPKDIPNVGSFFKNPILSRESFLATSRTYICTSPTGTSGEIPHFDVGNNMVKIPAGWLIENAGLKGKSFGNISVYDKNALVLVNNGEATKNDLMKAKNEIVKIVEQKFGITLEQEPEII